MPTQHSCTILVPCFFYPPVVITWHCWSCCWRWCGSSGRGNHGWPTQEQRRRTMVQPILKWTCYGPALKVGLTHNKNKKEIQKLLLAAATAPAGAGAVFFPMMILFCPFSIGAPFNGIKKRFCGIDLQRNLVAILIHLICTVLCPFWGLSPLLLLLLLLLSPRDCSHGYY